MKKFILVLLFTFFFFQLNTHPSFASVIFRDDFTDSNGVTLHQHNPGWAVNNNDPNSSANAFIFENTATHGESYPGFNGLLDLPYRQDQCLSFNFLPEQDQHDNWDASTQIQYNVDAFGQVNALVADVLNYDAVNPFDSSYRLEIRIRLIRGGTFDLPQYTYITPEEDFTQYHNLKMCAIGNNVTVYFDYAQVINFNDPELIQLGTGNVDGYANKIDNVLYSTSPDDVFQTPLESINELINHVKTLNLQQGISNSLDSKLEAANSALSDVNQNNNQAAINSLQAFINAVEAQRGNKITNEQADQLTTAAQAIINSL